ncbi:MAG: PAM68 family protein [Oscillatoriophycideae cyanobacterium NC_groundwater_1537_Pr4_S-0.65um_50_18]|nr:PAM68 family protein [Oscillatoriophycideae cyanobacterium NC_groundwater_1537_Pr4_S-0.65um_50_18]
MSSQSELDSSKGNSSETVGGSDTGVNQRRLLPFEPKKSRKPVDKAKDLDRAKGAEKAKSPDKAKSPGKAKGADRAKSGNAKAVAPKSVSTKSGGVEGVRRKDAIATSGIPDVVSRRMVWRMALLCGIPSALGMLTFVGSYLLVINDVNLPTYAVLLVSLGWFGLGVVGLSYGVLSASWDEEVVGSRLGWDEFTTNWGRMRANWRSNAELAKAARAEIEAKRAAKKAKSSQ